MADKHPHPLRTAIIATVVGGLILSAILMLRGFFIEAVSQAWAGAIWLWNALLSYYLLPGWVFLIIGLFAIFGLAIGIAVLYGVLQPQKEPAYQSYTEDMLYEAKWRWSWNGNKVLNLWCFCPVCDAELIPVKAFRETNFTCEHCPPDSEDYYHRPRGRVVSTMPGDGRNVINAVEREIRRRIRTGEYVSSINR